MIGYIVGGVALWQMFKKPNAVEIRSRSRQSTRERVGEAFTPTCLAWGAEAPSQAFIDKVVDIAKAVDTDPGFLMTQFYGESRFNPQAQLNSDGRSRTDWGSISKKTIGGGLFGLMRQWAFPALGVKFDDFIQMTDLQQLEFARKFYLKAKGKLRTMNDVFTYTFFPKALGKPDSYIIAVRGEPAYDQNHQMDTDGSGKITKGEAAAIRYALYVEGMRPENCSKLMDHPVGRTDTVGAMPGGFREHVNPWRGSVRPWAGKKPFGFSWGPDAEEVIGGRRREGRGGRR